MLKGLSAARATGANATVAARAAPVASFKWEFLVFIFTLLLLG
jgi:hypothetical protein